MKKATVFFTLALAALILFVSCGEDPFFHIVKVVNGDKTTETIVFNGDEYTLPENDGEGFQGWKVNDEESLKKPGEKIAIKKDTTVKAVFPGDDDAPVVIRLTYVLRDFEGNFEGEFKDDSVQTVIEDVEKVTLLKESDLNIPTGASFDGWYTEEDADGNRKYYKGGDEITITGDTKVYAHWIDDNLNYVDSNDGTNTVAVSSSNDSATSYKISEWYKGKKVTVIASKGFQKNKTFTTITIPKTIETIGVEAFGGTSSSPKDKAENLTTIIFAEGSSLKTIGQFAFGACNVTTNSETKELVLPASVKTVDQCAFQFNHTVKTITIPVTTELVINTQAFYDCDSLESIIIGSGITSFGSSVFDSCDTLESIIIQKSSDDIKKISGWEKKWTETERVRNKVKIYNVSGAEVN